MVWKWKKLNFQILKSNYGEFKQEMKWKQYGDMKNANQIFVWKPQEKKRKTDNMRNTND
jgi:hypothetical protein